MATTIITIEIATALHTALKAVAPAGCAVYAQGLVTDAEGNADPNTTELRRSCPMIDIIPGERRPQMHASVLREYPVTIRAITYGPHDQWKETLYTVAQAVSGYLCGPPSLSLSLVHFDSLVITAHPQEPLFAGPNDTLQYFEWQIIINTRTV